MSFLLNLFGGLGVQAYIYLALAFGGFGAGFYVEHLRFSEYATKVEALGKEAQVKTESVQKQQLLINKGIQNEYEGKLAALHNYYGRMQLNSSSRSMSNISAAPKGADAEAAYPILAGQCAETTLQVNLWQEWVTENGLIK
jgi:hypothetical protein